jgi:hypothetical protein
LGVPRNRLSFFCKSVFGGAALSAASTPLSLRSGYGLSAAIAHAFHPHKNNTFQFTIHPSLKYENEKLNFIFTLLYY